MEGLGLLVPWPSPPHPLGSGCWLHICEAAQGKA